MENKKLICENRQCQKEIKDNFYYELEVEGFVDNPLEPISFIFICCEDCYKKYSKGEIKQQFHGTRKLRNPNSQ